MARPQILQELKHDKFLTKSNFPFFVDSWNYVSNRIENIRGDADLTAQYGGGHITVDNSDPEHPVIRLVDLPLGGGGGGGLSGTVSFVGDIQYDVYSHQLQKRVDTLDLATGQVTQGQWTMITGGQAVPHSSVI